MEWINRNTILHDGVLLGIDSYEDGWAAVRAIQNYENKKKKYLIDTLKSLNEQEINELIKSAMRS